MSKSPFTIYQAGDGNRYAVNLPMVQHFAASTVRALVNDRHSKVVTDYSPANAFGQKAAFKSVTFDKDAAVKDFDVEFRQRYSNFWIDFQSSGPAAKQGLLRMRKQAELRIQTLAAKFQECGTTNDAALAQLESRVANARLIRDLGFTIVGAWATGGVSLGSMTAGTGAKIILGTALIKAGSKAADLNAEGKKMDSIDGGLIFVDFAADLMFAAVGGSGALQGAKQTVLFIACTKAPLEMAKAAATGSNVKQILFAGGFELAGPALDVLKGGIAKCLFPARFEASVSAHLDGFIGIAKDKASAALATPPASATGFFDSLFSYFSSFHLSDEQFIDRYVLAKQ